MSFGHVQTLRLNKKFKQQKKIFTPYQKCPDLTRAKKTNKKKTLSREEPCCLFKATNIFGITLLRLIVPSIFIA